MSERIDSTEQEEATYMEGFRDGQASGRGASDAMTTKRYEVHHLICDATGILKLLSEAGTSASEEGWERSLRHAAAAARHLAERCDHIRRRAPAKAEDAA